MPPLQGSDALLALVPRPTLRFDLGYKYVGPLALSIRLRPVVLNFCLVVVRKPGQVVLPAMATIYRIELDGRDLGQLLDGLEVRAEAWERTAAYLRGGPVFAKASTRQAKVQSRPEILTEEFFVIEECSKVEEAEAIAAHYRSIIGNIRRQMEEQSLNSK
jgi:hypothetical protein